MTFSSTRPSQVNPGDIVVYPYSHDADRVDSFACKIIGDFKGYRVVERGSDWLRLEAIWPDLELFGDWVGDIGGHVDFLKFVYRPVSRGSVDGYWRVTTWCKSRRY